MRRYRTCGKLIIALTIILPLFQGGCLRTVNPVDTSDPAITANLKAEIKKHPEINIQYLDINTHVGIVTLSGIIKSEETRFDLLRISRRIKGVKQVIANLIVQP